MTSKDYEKQKARKKRIKELNTKGRELERTEESIEKEQAKGKTHRNYYLTENGSLLPNRYLFYRPPASNWSED